MEMDLEYAQILVDRILSLCRAKGITINKLSEMSGVSQSTLDNLVNGRTFNPRIRTLHRIAYGGNSALVGCPGEDGRLASIIYCEAVQC